MVAYAVYRAESPEGPFQLLETLGGSVCWYEDTGLAPKTTYYYYVTAGDAAGNWSEPSDIASAATCDTEAPSAPGGLQATVAPGGSEAVLVWEPSRDNFGVTSYEVHRSESPTGPFELVGSADASTCRYEDVALGDAPPAGPAVLYYYVVALDAAGNTSAPSDTAAAVRPPAPTTLCASLTPAGNVGEDMSYGASVSAGGRWISFFSYAEDLVARDGNRCGDIFVRDVLTRETRLVSAAADGTPGNGASGPVSSVSLIRFS